VGKLRKEDNKMVVKIQSKVRQKEAIQLAVDEIDLIIQWGKGKISFCDNGICKSFVFETFEGPISAPLGAWAIKGIEDEFYPCKDSVFKNSYEIID